MLVCFLVRFWFVFDAGLASKTKPKYTNLYYGFGLVWFWFGFGLVLVWFWFGFGLVLVWFWYGFGMVLVWFWYGLNPNQNHTKTKRIYVITYVRT